MFGFIQHALFYLPGSQHHPDSVPEMGEDAVTSVSPSFAPSPMTEEERQELQEELVKVRRGGSGIKEVMVQGVLKTPISDTYTSMCNVCFGAPNTRPGCLHA